MGMARELKHRIAATLRDRFADGRFRWRTVLGAPSDDGVPVVMCAWARIDRFGEVLRTLDDQRDAPPIDLLVWNNRRAEHRSLVRTAASFAPSGSLRSVRVVRSPFNLSSIARFYLARRLLLDGRRGPFIVFDDDQRLPPDFVRIALDAYEPRIAAGVWAWAVLGDDYWQRVRAEPGGGVNHLGPGGMVADLALVEDRAFFDELPTEHWSMDDVWMSHFARSRGFELRRLPTDVEFIDDDHNMYPTLVERKIEFFAWLRSRER